MNFAWKASLAAIGGLIFMPAAYSQPADPAPNSPPAAQGSFTQDDIQKFAKSVLEVNKIQADTATPAADKQAKMLAAVQKNGLDPAKFDAIAQAAQSDPDLRKQIQIAAASQQQSRP